MVTPSRATARLRTVLVVVALPVLVVAVAWQMSTQARSGSHFGATAGAGEVKIHDFASHLTFAKTFWRGEGGYRVADHLRVTERLAGRPLPYALPFGYAPTMLWILGPLCALPTLWGFFAWTLLGLVGVWCIQRCYPSVAVAMVFISPVALACWGLGQTAVLTSVALLYLMRRDLASASTRIARHDALLLAGIVWALTAKPPLAIVAATALLAGRRLAIVAIAVAFTAVSTALILPWLGTAGLSEYAHLIGHYDLDTAAPAFAWSLRPETMGNLRALLHVVLGVRDGMASRVSMLLWLGACAAIVGAAARKPMIAEIRWSLAVLAYLLFCPHVSGTEQLHLVLIVAALAMTPRVPVSPGSAGAGIALVFVVTFLAPTIVPEGAPRVAAAFIATALLAPLLIGYERRNQAGKAPQTAPPSTA